RHKAVPAPVAPRSKLPNRRAWLAVIAVMGAGVIVVVATAPAAQVETTVALPLPDADPPPSACAAPVPAWYLDAPPVERIGYRAGRPHVFDVVRLGPTGVPVEVSTARAFLAMRDAAAKSCVDLRIESGFRTLAEQRELFRAWRRGQGNKAARPGQSNHQS